MIYISKCTHSQTHARGLDSEPRSLASRPMLFLPPIPPLHLPLLIIVHAHPCIFTADQREAAALIYQKLCAKFAKIK